MMGYTVAEGADRWCYVCKRRKDSRTGLPKGEPIPEGIKLYSSGLCRECEPGEYARFGIPFKQST